MPVFPTPDEFLQEATVGVLATVKRSGQPHAAPVWWMYEDGVFLISTDVGSQKHRNVEANPYATLVIDRRTLPYYALMIEGDAEIAPALSREQRLRLASRFLGEERARRYIEMTEGEPSVTIRLRPRKRIVFEGRTGRPETGG
jgi:PPOX class probable F420-dependent enzyme